MRELCANSSIGLHATYMNKGGKHIAMADLFGMYNECGSSVRW